MRERFGEISETSKSRIFRWFSRLNAEKPYVNRNENAYFQRFSAMRRIARA
ncbi:hypothetical protein U91I_00885 [alpha proteobacterium U9-1i]|nr:hypothetical protein U91I_00885 [alpha proteobacterium U9-1i]